MFSDIVMNYAREHFEEKLEALKQKEGVTSDADVSLEGLKTLVAEYKKMYKEHFGEEFPTDPDKQLALAIKAVFNSWNGARAIAYRDHEASRTTGVRRSMSARWSSATWARIPPPV